MDEKIKIPDGWEIINLDKNIDIISGYAFNSNYFNEDNKGMGLIRIRDLNVNKLNTFYSGSYDESYLVKKNDLLIGMDGEFYVVKWKGPKGLLNQRIMNIKSKGEINQDFLYYILIPIVKKIENKTPATTVKHLSINDIKNIKSGIPIEKKEQEKIASILQNIDRNIEKTEQIIEKQKKIKTGLMDDLLTGKIRIKDGKKYLETNFDVVDGIKKPADWEIKSFKEIAIICYGKDQKEIEVKNGKYQILGTGGEIGRTNTPLYSRPSVLIGRKGTIDKPMYIEKPFWTVDTLFYTNIKNIYNEKWFYYFIKTVNFLKLNEATGVPSLNTKSINKIKIIVPTENERNMIEEILSKQDRIIEKEEKYLEKLKKLKAGLMDDLLTGKKRVKF